MTALSRQRELSVGSPAFLRLPVQLLVLPASFLLPSEPSMAVHAAAVLPLFPLSRCAHGYAFFPVRQRHENQRQVALHPELRA